MKISEANFGWLLIGLGVGIVAGIAGMMLDGVITRSHVDAAPELRCVCSCDGDSAVLRIETEENDGKGSLRPEHR